MGDWLRSQIEKLTGTRRFAAGALALYVVGWLAERALTLFWEKLLEKQAPAALGQVSDLLATDLATGMALMALLVLFVPPVAQWIFESSAKLARFMELRSKRLSKREYLADIAREAIALAREARAITVMGRWDYGDSKIIGLTGQEAWDAREKFRAEQSELQGQALQAFVANKQGRIRFLLGEFLAYGFVKDIPRGADHITNYFCVTDLANSLEEAAHRTTAALARDGYPVSADDKERLQETENAEQRSVVEEL